MKRVSLDRTWELCIEMWEWIVAEWLKDRTQDIDCLKREWFRKRRFRKVLSSCFFCEYDDRVSRGEGMCDNCPGILVNSRFNCRNKTYAYNIDPPKFLAKIKQLNKTRKGE